MSKTTVYFLNGKKVDKKIIKDRKAKLIEKVIVEKQYYEAPLTDEEKRGNFLSFF